MQKYELLDQAHHCLEAALQDLRTAYLVAGIDDKREIDRAYKLATQANDIVKQLGAPFD